MVIKFYGKKHPLYADILFFMSLVNEKSGKMEAASHLQMYSTNIKCKFFGRKHI